VINETASGSVGPDSGHETPAGGQGRPRWSSPGPWASQDVTVIDSVLDVWPPAVTVIVAVPGWSGNGPVDGGRVNVIEVSLQLVMVSLAPS
jgi:hypothetical protein